MPSRSRFSNVLVEEIRQGRRSDTIGSDKQMAILGGNAARLFGIKEAWSRIPFAYSNLPSGPKKGYGPSKSPIGTWLVTTRPKASPGNQL
jgi:hypothetical protein